MYVCTYITVGEYEFLLQKHAGCLNTFKVTQHIIISNRKVYKHMCNIPVLYSSNCDFLIVSGNRSVTGIV